MTARCNPDSRFDSYRGAVEWLSELSKRGACERSPDGGWVCPELRIEKVEDGIFFDEYAVFEGLPDGCNSVVPDGSRKGLWGEYDGIWSSVWNSVLNGPSYNMLRAKECEAALNIIHIWPHRALPAFGAAPTQLQSARLCLKLVNIALLLPFEPTIEVLKNMKILPDPLPGLEDLIEMPWEVRAAPGQD